MSLSVFFFKVDAHHMAAQIKLPCHVLSLGCGMRGVRVLFRKCSTVVKKNLSSKSALSHHVVQAAVFLHAARFYHA